MTVTVHCTCYPHFTCWPQIATVCAQLTVNFHAHVARNLNYWDSVSTLAGEVAHPRRTFPRALFIAVALVCGITVYLYQYDQLENMVPLAKPSRDH